jgi:hypothetical protein
MNMGENETLMRAIFVWKLGEEARSWKLCVERGQPSEVPKTTMAWLQRLRRDFYPEEMSNTWIELTELRQENNTLQWLIESLTALQNQVEQKSESDMVRPLILEESVRRSDSHGPLTLLSAIRLAETFANQEIDLLRSSKKVQRGPKEVAKVKAMRVEQPAGERRFITAKRKRTWSRLIEERYLKGQCFLCGTSHLRHEACVGEVINLKVHIQKEEQTATLKRSTGKKTKELDGYSLSNAVLTASKDESAEESRSIKFVTMIPYYLMYISENIIN